MTRTLAAFAAASTLLAAAATPASAQLIPHDVVVFRGLDKITATVEDFEAPIDAPIEDGGAE